MGRKGRAPSDVPAPASPQGRAAVAGVQLAVVGTVLACSWRFDGAFTAPKLAWAAALAAAASWAAFLYGLRGLCPPRRAPLDAPLAAFFAAAVLSTVFSIDRPLSVLGHQGFYTYGLLAGVLFGALYMAASRCGAAEAPRGVQRAVAYSAGAVALLGLLQWMGVPVLLELSHALPEGRIYSTLGSPVYLGSLLALSAAVCARLSVAEGAEAAAGRVALACVLLAAVATQSRAALVGCAAGLAVWGWLSGRLARPSERALKAGAAALLLLAVLGASVWSRRTARSDAGRLAVWRTALAIAAERPLMGVGTAAFEDAFLRRRGEDTLRALGPEFSQSTAHNEPLQQLATTGLLGLAAYLACLWAAMLSARRALAEPGRREDAAAAAGALAGLFANTLFEPLPFAAAVPAAVLLGTLAPARGAPASPRASTVLRLAAALLCTAAAWGAARLTLADYWSKSAHVARARKQPEAALASLRSALLLAPYETKFRMEAVKVLLETAGAQADPARKLALAEEARRVSADGVRLRPAHSDSWKTQGYLLVILARAGTPALWPGAAAALERALVLDPWSPSTLEQAALAAQAQGDAEAAARLRARRARAEELRPK